MFSFQIFGDHYHFHHSEIQKRSIEPSHHHQTRLNNDNRVRWSKQQRVKSRKKRDFLTFQEPKVQSYPMMMMGKNRISTTDPKWPQMWYLVSKFDIFLKYITIVLEWMSHQLVQSIHSEREEKNYQLRSLKIYIKCSFNLWSHV